MSCIWRISLSPSPITLRKRLAFSIASSFDLTWTIAFTGDQLLRFREVTENLPQICSDKERLFNEIVLATTDEVNQVVRLVTSTRPTPGT